MSRQLRARFLKALELLPLTEIADGIGRAYSTMQAYRRGERRVTPAVAQKLARYLRERAEEFHQVADRLEAAADREEDNG